MLWFYLEAYINIDALRETLIFGRAFKAVYVCQQALNSELLFSNHLSVFLIIAVSLQFVPNNYDVFSLNLWEIRKSKFRNLSDLITGIFGYQQTPDLMLNMYWGNIR